MKKLILCLCFLLLICGCSKKVTWQEVEENYLETEQEVGEIADSMEEIVEDDYQALLTELGDYVGDIEYSQEQDNQDLLKRTYKVAQYLQVFASMFNGNCAQQIIALSANTKDLIKSVYDGNEDEFDSLKSQIQLQISDISSWANDQWSTVEKKTKILWDSVADQISEIETNAKSNLTDFNEVAENELEELKHTIIDNYQLIKDGVTKDTDNIAKTIYDAAYKLEQYTRRIYSDEADKVWYFAKYTESYVKQCYGKALEETDKVSENFENDIESARKWTQSTWNEITKELKLLVMQ